MKKNLNKIIEFVSNNNNKINYKVIDFKTQIKVAIGIQYRVSLTLDDSYFKIASSMQNETKQNKND